ncbi:DUF3813 domain-containing protein [Heyndrickxia camelliae]|uniref:DUF3813 domain-containing protein n=1 Tax=Heyndrickxia camelliae TaxID=1707093 RepID=A0A2N3LQD8_9BACI|nr:DUF3813 domain-containing protein [Heyndrickxia camelliae]PKR86744.1 DUF3813 domain-containing protein [Heyndrickxia camelliae]
MTNRLFQQAKFFVERAKGSPNDEQTIQKAKNALSSAFANSTIAEQNQLNKMQDELEQLK